MIEISIEFPIGDDLIIEVALQLENASIEVESVLVEKGRAWVSEKRECVLEISRHLDYMTRIIGIANYHRGRHGAVVDAVQSRLDRGEVG